MSVNLMLAPTLAAGYLLFRVGEGLRRRRRGLSVDFLTVGPQPEVLRHPAIAGVRLGSGGGAGHFVTVLDATEEHYIIGEPLHGRLAIPRGEVHRRYYFTGFFMVVGEP